MFSKHLFYAILLHILLILLTAGGSLFLIATGTAYILGLLAGLFSIFQIANLVRCLNARNRQIAFFLNTIEDNESTFYFPVHKTGADQRLLYESFNRINHLIGEMRIKSREQEYFYKAMLENIPGGVIAWDNTGKILTVNDTALKLLECSRLTERKQLNDISPDFERLPDPSLSVVKIFTTRGICQLAVTCTVMRLRERFVTLLSIQDINEALNEKEADSWNKLTHILTHEIMNSIAPITSLSEMLADYFEQNGVIRKQEEITEQTIEKTLKGLNIIQRRGNSLLRFTEAYRQLTALPEPEIQSLSVRDIANNLLTLLQSDLEKENIQLNVHIVPETLLVRADENLLSQVMLNLLQNAIQALTLADVGQKTICVEANATDQHTIINIMDNGPGIPQDILENIFVPFFTTKTSGSGIGLSLSRQIIRLHKGQLQVSSSPGSETCFSILLPK